MHTFKNFKNFADVEIDLSKPMTLLIGRKKKIILSNAS